MSKYRNCDSDAMASLFALCWCVVVLNPRHGLRGFLRSAGLIKKKGPLALSPKGKRILREFKKDDPKSEPAA